MFSKLTILISFLALTILASEAATSKVLAIKETQNLIDQGAFLQAKEKLTILLKEYPQDATTQLTAASFYQTIGSYDLATTHYKQILSLSNATSAQTNASYLGLAQIYLATSDNKESLFYAQKAIAADPISKEAQLVLINALLSNGKTNQANLLVTKLLSANNTLDPDVAYLAYKVNLAQGHLRIAKQFLDEALKLQSSQIIWLLDQADLDQSLGDYLSAKEALTKFVAQVPRSTEGLNKLANLLEFHFNDLEEAKQQYQKILSIDPDYIAALSGLDRCLAKQNDWAGQMKSWLLRRNRIN